MRTIGLVTVARSDYSYFLPILRKIQGEPALRLHLFVSGAHLSPEQGETIQIIKGDGFPIAETIKIPLASDRPEGIARAIGETIIGFSQAYVRRRPDLLLVLGDRYEMFAAVSASIPFNIPVAHIHGGESTEGLIDEAMRHSMTKMSHLHFVSTEFYGERVIQMGEEPWRVTVSGAPSLDNLQTMTFLGREELEKFVELDLQKPTLLVTFHPVTLEIEQTFQYVQTLLAALERSEAQLLFTFPNADTMGRAVLEKIQVFVKQHPKARLFTNLGTQRYFSLLKIVRAMVGNSSSGIIEAASFKLPVVNIGNRQRGRVHGKNVLSVGTEEEKIVEALQKALSPEFRKSLSNLENPYGDGQAADRIVALLKSVPLNETLLLKRFYTPPQRT